MERENRPLNEEQKFFAALEQRAAESESALSGPDGITEFYKLFVSALRESGLTELDGYPIEEAKTQMQNALEVGTTEDVLPSVRGLVMRYLPTVPRYKEAKPVTPENVVPISRGQEIVDEGNAISERFGALGGVLRNSKTIGDLVNKLTVLNSYGPNSLEIDGVKAAHDVLEAYTNALKGRPDELEALPKILKEIVKKIILADELKTKA